MERAVRHSYALALPVANDGDVNLARMTLTVTLPVDMTVSSVMTGSYTGLTDFAAGEGVRVSYEKNTAPGVFTLWGSSPNVSTNTTLTSPPPGVGAGEYLTRVRWEYGPAVPGMNPIVPARLSGRATNPDNSGGPVGPTDPLQTCGTLSGETTAVPPVTPVQNVCRSFNLVTGPTVAIDAPDSTPLGSPTHASVSLSGGDPTGTVSFSVYAADDAACATPLFEDDVAVDGAGTYAGPDFPATAAGAYKWVARYGGDSVHAAAATACGNPAGAFAVVAPPSASASFTPETITADQSSVLTFTITNPPANTVPLSGVALATTLPAGLAVASPNGLDGSCGGGVITAVPGTHVVLLTGGSLPMDGSCTFSVDVTAPEPGKRTATTDAVQSANGGAGNTATAELVVQAPDATAPPASPPPPASQPPAREQPAEPAISELELLSRCVRPSRSGRVRLRLRMLLTDPAALRIRFERGVGSKALRKCPTPGAGRPFAGRYKPVKTREEAAPPLATAASLKHLVRLRLRLKPGLYRVTVRAVLEGGRLSSPQRAYLRVLRR